MMGGMSLIFDPEGKSREKNGYVVINLTISLLQKALEPEPVFVIL
jgi:hypothetical protein